MDICLSRREAGPPRFRSKVLIKSQKSRTGFSSSPVLAGELTDRPAGLARCLPHSFVEWRRSDQKRLTHMDESVSRRHFDRVAVPTAFDDGPGKYRIGLIALSNDYTTERDFTNMRPSDQVAIFTSRLSFAPDCSVGSLSEMVPRITEAASLLVPQGRLDVIAYCCTSGTAVIGFERIQDLIRACRPGVACSTPLTASLEGLD